MKEHDHAQLRDAIVEVVRQTDLKVLICPEDQTQMQVGKEMLFDQLPGRCEAGGRLAADLLADGRGAQHLCAAAPACSATRCTRRSCASATAFPPSSAAGQSRRARATCGATSGSATGCLIIDDEEQVKGVAPAGAGDGQGSGRRESESRQGA